MNAAIVALSLTATASDEALPIEELDPPVDVSNVVQLTDRSIWYWTRDGAYRQVPDDGSEGHTVAHPCSGYGSVQVSPDDRWMLAACSDDEGNPQTAMIEVATGKTVARSDLPVGNAWFSRDGGHLLVTGFDEAPWRVVDRTTLEPVGAPIAARKLFAHAGVVAIADGWAYTDNQRIEVIGTSGRVIRSHDIVPKGSSPGQGVKDSTCAFDDGRAFAWVRDGSDITTPDGGSGRILEVVDATTFAVRGSQIYSSASVLCAGSHVIALDWASDDGAKHRWDVLDAEGEKTGHTVTVQDPASKNVGFYNPRTSGEVAVLALQPKVVRVRMP